MISLPLPLKSPSSFYQLKKKKVKSVMVPQSLKLKITKEFGEVCMTNVLLLC